MKRKMQVILITVWLLAVCFILNTLAKEQPALNHPDYMLKQTGFNSYQLLLFDEQRQVLHNLKYHIGANIDIAELENHFLEIRWSVGTSAVLTQYYKRDTRQLSVEYYNSGGVYPPLCLRVYGEYINDEGAYRIIVEDMFDSKNYRKVITSDEFIDGAFDLAERPIENVDFIDENTVEIEYSTKKAHPYRLVKKTFDLREY